MTPKGSENAPEARPGAVSGENRGCLLRRLNGFVADDDLGGRELVLRLELLQERYRLNPAERTAAPTTAEPTQIVCSDGLL